MQKELTRHDMIHPKYKITMDRNVFRSINIIKYLYLVNFVNILRIGFSGDPCHVLDGN